MIGPAFESLSPIYATYVEQIHVDKKKKKRKPATSITAVHGLGGTLLSADMR